MWDCVGGARLRNLLSESCLPQRPVSLRNLSLVCLRVLPAPETCLPQRPVCPRDLSAPETCLPQRPVCLRDRSASETCLRVLTDLPASQTGLRDLSASETCLPQRPVSLRDLPCHKHVEESDACKERGDEKRTSHLPNASHGFIPVRIRSDFNDQMQPKPSGLR